VTVRDIDAVSMMPASAYWNIVPIIIGLHELVLLGRSVIAVCSRV
jgi:hypothetical protein